jgi:hypothetical protein
VSIHRMGIVHRSLFMSTNMENRGGRIGKNRFLGPSEQPPPTFSHGWNTDWMLIIPGGTFLFDNEQGWETFINSGSDIKIFFQTYAISGN